MNQPQIARQLGVSVSTVSRIISGTRLPGVKLMIQIRSVLAWRIDHQIDAMQRGTYHSEFEYRMNRRRTRV